MAAPWGGEGTAPSAVAVASFQFHFDMPTLPGGAELPRHRLPFSLFDSRERPEDSTGGVISDSAGCCHWASPGEAPPVCVRPHHSYLNSLGRLHLLRDKKVMTVSAGASLLERI